VTVSRLPVIRCQICQRTLAHRPGQASTVLTDAIFNAGLRRFRAQGEPWKPGMTSYYFINESTQPSFVVDVTAHYEIKRRALASTVAMDAAPVAYVRAAVATGEPSRSTALAWIGRTA